MFLDVSPSESHLASSSVNAPYYVVFRSFLFFISSQKELSLLPTGSDGSL